MSKSRTPTARLLDAPDYVADLVAAINAAKTRVAITSMIIAGDKTTNALFMSSPTALRLVNLGGILIRSSSMRRDQRRREHRAASCKLPA
jgi:hypothetical protein